VRQKHKNSGCAKEHYANIKVRGIPGADPLSRCNRMKLHENKVKERMRELQNIKVKEINSKSGITKKANGHPSLSLRRTAQTFTSFDTKLLILNPVPFLCRAEIKGKYTNIKEWKLV